MSYADKSELTAAELAKLDDVCRGRSPRDAAKLLGVGRESLLSIAGGFRVTRGTLALVREALSGIGSDAKPSRKRGGR